MNFTFRHVARAQYPTHHILICEDDLDQQVRFLNKMRAMFEPQGLVQVSIVPGSLMASSILAYTVVDLIILDHDMPLGNGSDLLAWMAGQESFRKKPVPILFASGIPYNNAHMKSLCTPIFTKLPDRLSDKETVLCGDFDDFIREAVQ